MIRNIILEMYVCRFFCLRDQKEKRLNVKKAYTLFDIDRTQTIRNRTIKVSDKRFNAHRKTTEL